MGLWCVALFGCGGGSILGRRATKGPVVVLRVYSIQYFQHKFYLFSHNYVLSDKSRIFFCETQNIYHSFTCLVTQILLQTYFCSCLTGNCKPWGRGQEQPISPQKAFCCFAGGYMPPEIFTLNLLYFLKILYFGNITHTFLKITKYLSPFTVV